MAHAAVLAAKDKFCNAYFPNPDNPTPNKPRPVLDENPFAQLAQLPKFKGNEAKVQAEFVKAVNDHNLIPGLVLRVCGNRPDGIHIDPTQQKVDAAWYFEHEAEGTGAQEWGDQVIPVEFKGDEVGDDPYDDKKDNISTRTKSRKKARGQMTSYSEILHAVQQRTALFMLIVTGKRARFTRWDRSGTVVTQSFNYIDEWRFFCDVLWRIGHCSRTQLGFDPTATRLSEGDADWQRMRAALEEKEYVDYSERKLENGKLPEGEFTYVRDMFKESLARGWPRYRVAVPHEVPADDASGADAVKKVRHFLIAKPTFRAKGMAGRGTRGYVALDCETNKFVWLKDAWRANYEFVRKEGDILAGLNQAKVSSIPTMLCHGDIEGQTTETPHWWVLRNSKKKGPRRSNSTTDATRSSVTYVNPSTSSHLKRKLNDDDEPSTKPVTETAGSPLRLHQHYRLVVEEVAMPLDRFEYPQQLVQVIFDCVFAHYEASTKPKEPLLHRDISSGNILIYPRISVKQTGEAYLQWHGILADWEMSKPLSKGNGLRQPRQPERTGTWQYTSVALLSAGVKLVAISDELESFFHVFLYYAVRYTKSVNCDGEEIAHFLDKYFDVYGYENGAYICGEVKTSTIRQGTITVGNQTLQFDNPLDDLFSTMLSWFRARYLIYDHSKNTSAPTVRKDALADSSDLHRGLFKQDGTTSDILAQFGDVQFAPSQRKKGPSEEERNLAKILDSHAGLVVMLGRSLRGDWPPEKAEDQIPETWKPSDKFPYPPSRNVKNKRQRIREAKVAQSEPLFAVAAADPLKTPPPKRTIRSLNLGVDEGEDSDSSWEARSDSDSDYVDESK